MQRFTKLYSLIFALGLTAFSVYAVLDTFVIPRVYETVEQSVSSPAPARTRRMGSGSRSHGRVEADGSSEAKIAAAGGASGVSVTLSTCNEYDTVIHVAEVYVPEGASLQTAFSRSSYGRNVTAAASATAGEVNAVLAVNGDNYGSREKGYVIRNGVLYRDVSAGDQEDLVVWTDGSFSIVSESEVTAQELLEQGARQVFSFGPGLLADGEIIVDTADEVDRAMASNPRTAIGITEDGHYVLVVSDGRSAESAGLTLYELAEFMQSLGVRTAYNLDGGGSSTMVYQGSVVNEPSGGRERAVTDIVYFA